MRPSIARDSIAARMHPTIHRLTILALALAACAPDPNGTDSAGGSSSAATTSSTSSASDTSTSATETSSPTTTSGPSSTTADTSSDTAATTAGGTSGEPPPPAAACGMDGGICVGAGTCAPAGGTVAPSSPGGCFFDDGPAECCVPPAPKPGAMTCADAGGLCAPIGGCLDAGGYMTSIDAGCDFQGVFACCVPHDRCGDQTIECCDGQAVFNPMCDEGMFVCPAGAPQPIGTCL